MDLSTDLVAVFAHDDRLGPYVREELVRANGALKFMPKRNGKNNRLRVDSNSYPPPMHAKIRLAFSGLREIAIFLADSADALLRDGTLRDDFY